MAPQCRFTCSVARKSADGTVTHFCRGHCGTPAPTWGMRGRRSNAAGHAASTRMRYARRRRELTPARPAPREEELVISVQLCRPVPQHPPRLLSFHCCCCRTRLCVSQLAVCVCVCVHERKRAAPACLCFPTAPWQRRATILHARVDARLAVFRRGGYATWRTRERSGSTMPNHDQIWQERCARASMGLAAACAAMPPAVCIVPSTWSAVGLADPAPPCLVLYVL